MWLILGTIMMIISAAITHLVQNAGGEGIVAGLAYLVAFMSALFALHCFIRAL